MLGMLRRKTVTLGIAVGRGQKEVRTGCFASLFDQGRAVSIPSFCLLEGSSVCFSWLKSGLFVLTRNSLKKHYTIILSFLYTGSTVFLKSSLINSYKWFKKRKKVEERLGSHFPPPSTQVANSTEG